MCREKKVLDVHIEENADHKESTSKVASCKEEELSCDEEILSLLSALSERDKEVFVIIMQRPLETSKIDKNV